MVLGTQKLHSKNAKRFQDRLSSLKAHPLSQGGHLLSLTLIPQAPPPHDPHFPHGKDIASLTGLTVVRQENLLLGHSKMRQEGREEDRKTDIVLSFS